jgi:mannose-6-phosphate isomerase
MYSETRPWGAFHILDEGPGFKVKRITVNPGGKLSLQSHKHRGEHWTVVNGIATVTVDDTVKDLRRSEAVDIPQGAKHRLENLHTDMVEIIEVQFGDYLGEDDIVRYDDIYNRS